MTASEASKLRIDDPVRWGRRGVYGRVIDRHGENRGHLVIRWDDGVEAMFDFSECAGIHPISAPFGPVTVTAAGHDDWREVR